MGIYNIVLARSEQGKRIKKLCLNRRDVTKNAFEASLFKVPKIPMPGFVRMYKVNDQGEKVLDRSGTLPKPITETKFGLVSWQ